MTWANAKIKHIYVWENLVRPVWKPWNNTIFYYPLETNINDYSWNNRNWTIQVWSLSYTTSWWTKNVAQFNWNTIFSIPNIAWTYSTYTFNVWCKPTSTNTWQEFFSNIWTGNTNNVYSNFNWTAYELGWWKRDFAFQYRPNGWSNTYQNLYWTVNRDINTWYNVCIIWNSSWVKIYLNWTQIVSWNTNWTIVLNNHTNWQWWTHIWWRYDNNWQYKNYLHWYLSEFIFENKTWSATEVSDYYNNSKFLYWL
jgi:hypothetical protein